MRSTILVALAMLLLLNLTAVLGHDGQSPQRVFHIMVVWGRIQPNGQSPTAVRWDPTLSVAEGDAIGVLRTLRFERRDEVLPQLVRNQVLMTSNTGPGVDGVMVEVAITSDDADGPVFSFQSEKGSLTVSGRDLVDLNEFVVLDEAGNGIVMVSSRTELPDDECAHGFVHGRWLLTGHQSGVFGGGWRTQSGRLAGHVAGRFGVDTEGNRVFHGKLVNRDGHFIGLVAGSWGDGAYRGEIYGRQGNVLGYVRGHYAVADGGHGLFRGAWQQVCENDEDDPTCCPTSCDCAGTEDDDASR